MKKFVIQKEIYFLISCILFSGNIFSQQLVVFALDFAPGVYTHPTGQFLDKLR